MYSHGWLDYEFGAGKNYHNFEMEYAVKLQQVSTCFLGKDLQFGTYSSNKLTVVWVIYRQRSLFLNIK